MSSNQAVASSALPGVRPFLQRPVPVAIILLSFAAITVPLTLMTVLGANHMATVAFFITYHITFSITHFFLTAWLYFDPRNRQYFASSWLRRLIYVAVPAALMLGVWAIGFFRVDPAYGDYEPTSGLGPMAYAFFFAFAVRAIDYRHSTRQSFGVLQLIKVQPGARFPAWTKAVDRTLFSALFLLETQTFAAGGRFTPTPLMLATVAVAAALFAGSLVGFYRAWRAAPDRRVLRAPLAYLVFQTTAACLTVWRFELYAISLAMHFTEYHVLMAPRCFERAPNSAAAPRRIFFLRRSWIAGYVVLILLALGYYLSEILDLAGIQTQSQLVWAMTNVFNGIFLAHFFLEAFVWRFSNPFYRSSVGPVYFPRPAAQPAVAAA